MPITAKTMLAIASISAGILTGCGGNAQTEGSAIPSVPAPSGALPSASAYPRDLYVADTGTDSVDLFHGKKYHKVGSITKGIDYPVDVFLDPDSNLYVANLNAANVVEYAPGNTAFPSFTYSANMLYPSAVTTDRKGHLFEGEQTGTINEYDEGTNSTIASCTPSSGFQITGLAVDSHNDLFAAITDTGIVEYAGGLGASCSETSLPVTINPHGMALDKNRNLIVAAGAVVDVVDAPSYNAINSTIGSGFSCAVNVRLNKTNALAFVSDVCNNTVTVVGYPSGTNVTVLGTANGLENPSAAVDWPNAVY
jgi:hypothetical protein